MKTLLNRGFKKLWGWSAPLRRPIARKVDGHLHAATSRTIQEQVTPALDRVETALQVSHEITRDMDRALNSLVRELARLQMQVEILEQSMKEPV